MAIPIGTRLGVYEIRELLGVGGMGEVYRALDSKLNREVALKVLPPAFARDPERIIRFRREAQLLAQLNHPNIAAIYYFEETPEARFLVMELVLGETLRERIKRGPLPIEETLTIGKQIAEALEHAHEKPIIHRDLKPANVKVTPQGQVKVLDFGLAKAFGGDKAAIDPHDAPTGSLGGTLAGTILGTPGYMSPEQASGKEVDKRADIWALGCLLYELLTGKQAFPGDSVTEIIAGVLRGEPDWTALPEATPLHLRSFLRRCLEKDAKRRFRDAADIAIQLDEAKGAPATLLVAKAAPPAPLWRRALPFVLTGLVAAAIVGGIAIWNRPAPPPAPRPISRFAVPLPPADRIQVAYWPSVAISPDGTHVVYTGAGAGGQLYLRSLDSPEVKPIPGTRGGYNPFFSPDGQWLGFFTGAKLMKVALSGGPAVTLSDARFVGGATWGPDDTIVFGDANAEGIWSLLRVPATGGTPTVLTKPDSAKGETEHGWPEFLPGGKTLLFTIQMGDSWDNAQIAALNLESGERRVLIQGGTYPRYAPTGASAGLSTGHLVYYRAGTVMAVPFDPDRLEVTGAPAPVLEGVMSRATSAGNPTGSGAVGQFGFSQTGSLVYVAGLRTAERTLVWVDRKGAVQPLGAPPRAYNRPALSPDGKQVAVNIVGQTSDVWIYDIERGTLTRLTFEGNNSRPVWTPDGKRIVFGSNRGGSINIFWKLADGTGPEEQIISSKFFINVSSISPDGKLGFITLNPAQGGISDLGTIELQGERKPRIFLQTPFDESAPQISPDGRWVAYMSDESGRYEVYVRAFPGPEGKWQISTDGGIGTKWARNGRELFYVSSSGKLMVVDITTEPTFKAGTPRVLLEGTFQFGTGTVGQNYDIAPDGQRFLVIQGSDANLTQLNVVLNWFEELKRRVPLR